MSKSQSGRKSGKARYSLSGIIITVVVLLACVLTAKVDDRADTLWDKLGDWIRREYGMSLDELNATPEMKQLRDSGLPEEAIYPSIQGQYGKGDLYTVTDNSYVTVRVLSSPPYREWTVKDAGWTYDRGSLLPDVVAKLEPVESGDSACARVYFGTFPPEAYHQTYTMASITVHGTQATMQRQLNWQPWSSTRKDIEFFVVSQEEKDILVKLHNMCQSRLCNFPQD